MFVLFAHHGAFPLDGAKSIINQQQDIYSFYR